jgi:hypothetical protein
MIVKAMQASGVANYSDIAAAMNYAAAKGAQVINISLGGYADSATLRTAIEVASSTAVIVGGAGNDNVSTPFYPAAYSNVLAAASTTISDTKASFSDYGPWVDVAAPGVAISTTFSGGDYGTSEGTSLSAPLVAGLAGLIKSAHPDWSPALVRAQIIHTTAAITETQLGSGRVDAASAIQAPQPLFSISSYTVNGTANGRPDPNSGNALMVNVTNDWLDATNVVGTLSESDPFVTVVTSTASFGNIASGATQSSSVFSFTAASGAGYNHPIAFTLNLSADDGAYTATFPLTITTQTGIVLVSGFISSDMTWTRDHIYELVSNVQVDPGVALTIQPGTVVQAQAGRILQIAGTLIADGQPNAPIIFTSAASKTHGAWGPINFVSSAISATVDADGNYVSGSIIRYARIEYGTGIGILKMLPYISNDTFIRNSATYAGQWQGCCDSGVVHYNDPGNSMGGGIGPFTDTLAVRHSTFVDNEGAAVAIASISNKRFEVADNLIIDQAGPAVAQGPIGGYTSQITGNRLLRTHGFSILGSGFNTTVENNYVSDSTGPGYTAGFGVDIYIGSPIIRNNVFANNGRGQTMCNGHCSVINIFSGGAPTVISNTFVGNWLDSLIYFNWGGGGIYQHNNWAGNRVSYIFYRSTQSTQDVTATLNYWGTTDTAVIDGSIYDYLDDFNPGRIYYQPVLSEPEPTAPAFLWNASVTPNPVGIQQATFTVTFSAPMNQSINPIVTFGVTQPYTSFAILDNAQWISDRVWRATYDVTSLVPRGVYTISVSSVNGLDGIPIPTDARFVFTVDYAGSITDQTPPPAPSVSVDFCANSTTSVAANWSASDPNSAITLYRYALGSSTNSIDVINWTDTGNTYVMRTGLKLVTGQRYYFSVKARNAGGLWSEATSRSFTAGLPCQKVYLPLVRK